MTINTKFYSGLECNLNLTLIPFEPDPEFVQRLEKRLARRPSVSVEKSYNRLLGVATIGAGLATGVFLVWGLRKLFSFGRG